MNRILLLIAFAFPLSGQAQTSTTFVPLQSVWKYLDNGSNQGTAWRALGFSDATWAQGPGELGYGDGGEATVVSFGPNSAAKYITTYFRKSFTVTGAATYTSASLRVRRDDGVVIYLNGTEIYRNNLPTGTVTYTTLAPAAIGGADESALLTAAVNAALLTEGTNVLAVEIHQNAGGSSDISFDMDFTATAPAPGAPVANAQSVTFDEDTPAVITLTGSDPENSPLTFSIVSAPGKGTLTGTPPSVTYTPFANTNGADSFTFKVNDGTFDSAAATVSLTVNPLNDAPSGDAQSVTAMSTVPLAITLSGSDPESHYGMLTDYTQQLFNGDLTAIIDGLSGATWNAATGTLFFIRNVSTGAGHSYEYTADGVALRTITQSGFQDTEAIAWMYGNTYAIAEENNFQRITICTIAPGATTLDRTAAGNVSWNTAVGSLLNLGVESLCYDTGRDLLYYIAEKPSGGAWNIYTMNPATGVSSVLCNLNASVATAGVATDISDMAHDRATDTLLLLSHESSKIIRVSRGGAVQEQRGFTTAFTQAEALALTPDRTRLFIGGEPKQFARYALPADTLTYNLVTPPANGTLSGLPPALTYMATDGYVGPDSFTFTVSDGVLTSPPATVSITVVPYSTPQPVITRGPYVQMTGADRATVRWRTDAATTSKLDYGLTTTALTSSAANSTIKTEHEITLTGLTPDTRFYYAAGNSSGVIVSGSTYYFTTHPKIGTVRPYRFWVLGDPGTGDGNQTAVRNAFYTWNGAQKLDGVLVLGDTVYETGTDLEFQTKFFNMYPTMLRNTTVWPTFGNHDAGSASSATQSGPYYDSFTMPKLGEVGGVASGTEAYYSFDIGNIHFVCLDSEGTSRLTTGNMAAWLEQDLSATTQEWIVAYWHHPPYSKGAHDSDIPTADGGRMKDMREVFVPILENHGVDLLLFGHEHNYQRSKFIDGHYGVSSTFDPATMVKQTGLGNPVVDGPYIKGAGPHNGAIYTVAGSSGKLTIATLNHAAMAVNHTELGSVVLDVNGRELMARFLNSTGVIRDTFSIVHNSAPLAAAATVTGSEDTPLAVTLSASDAENDALTYEIVSPPAVGTLTGTAPALTYTPPANFNGSATLQFRVNDGRVNSATVTVTLDIAPVNDAPLAASQSVTAPEDSLAAIILAGTDGDGDALTFTITTMPVHGTLTGVLPDVTFIPDANWNGADSFAFTVSDATLTSAPAVISLTVTPVNDAPVAAAVAVTTPEDSAAAVVLRATDIEGDALTFAIATSPAHGTLSGTAPNLTYTPDADWNGEDSFTYIANDGLENSSPGIATITVTPGNDPPLAAAQVVATAEDSPAAIMLAGSDPDGDALTFTVTILPARGTLSGIAPNLTYTPEANWSGSDSFSFTVSDAAGSSPAVQISLTVTAVNDAPAGASQAVSTAEDTSTPITLAGTDTEGAALTFTVNVPPVHGTLTGTAPEFTYVPAANYYGPDSFTYLVNDGQADSAAATVNIAVSPVNDAPLAAAQILAGTEDIALPITLTGSDPDGDTLSFAVATQPAHGILSGIAPNLTYTPEANWTGTDSFTFIASDGAANSAAASVSITVTPGNTAPLAAAQTVATDEDVPASLILAGSDADGDALTYAIITQPEHGVLSGIAPGLTYTPDPNRYGADSFTFTVNDGRAASAPAQVTINVASVNDTPSALAQSVSTAEDVAAALILTGSDADGDALTFIVTAQPLHGTLSGTAPNLTYTPEPNWSGADSFTFTASDATETSPAATIALDVTAVDDAPVAIARSAATSEDSPISLTLTGTDTEGAVLTFTIATKPEQGPLNGTPPEVTYTPVADWNGSDSFAFTVSDGTNVSTPAIVNIAVTPVSDPPRAGSQSLSGTEDTAVTLTLAGSDADGDALTFTLTALPVHGTLTGVLPALTYFPDANWSGTDSFAFSVSDGANTSPAAVVALTIAPANDAPVADTIVVTTDEDAAAALVLTGSDIEGDALTFSIATPPSHGTLSGAAPNLRYTPEADWNGEDNFTFIVSDGVQNSIPGVATIVVRPVNDVPLAVAQSLSTTEDSALPVTLGGTDVDGDVLTFTVTVPPSRGSLSGTAPELTYTPEANWSGEDTFNFTVADGAATSAPVSVSINVTPVNDVPVATPVSVTTEVGVPVAVTLTGSDVEGDALTWSVTALPAFGTLSGSGAARTYMPNLAWSGIDQFTFTVSDGTATSAAFTATITVGTSGPWQIVARTGHTAPGAGGAVFSIIATDFVSDATGRASFRGTAGTITGIWTEGAAGLEAVAAQTAAAPGATGAVFDAVTTGPWAAGDGELLVFGKLLTGTGGVTSSNDLGYWHRSGGAISLLARENSPVPGMPAAARFNVLSAVATLEAGGNYAWAASMQTNSSLGISSANDTGMWATFGSPVRLLVRENNAAPGSADGGLFDTLTTASVVSNGAGQLGFSTALKVAGSVTTANRYGLWMWDPVQFGLVARGGNAAPGTPAGAVFAQPQNPSFGDGAMGFRSTLKTKSGGVTSANDTGLWILENGVVSLLAREGAPPENFNNLTEGVSMNGGNELVFRANLLTGPGSASLWSRSRFTSNVLAMIARQGTDAPGAGTATFASFDYPFIADDGGEAFTATLTTGTGGVTTSNDRGLWLRNAAGILALALREGNAFTLAPGDVRTVSNITLPAARSSGRTPLSKEGRLLVLLTFTDASTALYHYTLP